MNPTYPERIHLAHLPTAVHQLPRLSEYLGGPEILIKRDDQTGLALGGNKTRKLEFLGADAVAKGCDYLVTTGAAQSNHCRQTAAAAAAMGLGCGLVLRGEAPSKQTGNLLLDTLVGADLFWTGSNSADDTIEVVLTELESQGHKPYFIPLGGSNKVGAVAYALAMQELVEQLAAKRTKVDAILVASSSGGTQAGLILGADLYGFEGEIVGVSIDHPAKELTQRVSDLAAETAAFLGLSAKSYEAKVLVADDYLGAGYGIMGDLERNAIKNIARLEGILLDPVYTARAMGGLLDMIGKGRYGSSQKVLFWHTGGSPALFAYGNQLF
jgi:D-cysteine desulfhydrase